jgi:hypothetical protein
MMPDKLSPKLNVDLTKAVVFCVVFLGVCILIGLDKLETDYLKYLLAWLIPGPLSFEKEATNEQGKD